MAQRNKSLWPTEPHSDNPLIYTADYGSVWHKLIAVGFLSKPLDLSKLDDKQSARTVTAFQQCLATLQARQDEITEFADQIKLLRNENERLRSSMEQKDTQVQDAEIKLRASVDKAKQATDTADRESRLHKEAKEELNKARLAIIAVRNQAAQEQKKRDNEVAGILAKWAKLSSSDSRPVQPSISIKNAEAGSSKAVAKSGISSGDKEALSSTTRTLRALLPIMSESYNLASGTTAQSEPATKKATAAEMAEQALTLASNTKSAIQQRMTAIDTAVRDKEREMMSKHAAEIALLQARKLADPSIANLGVSDWKSSSRKPSKGASLPASSIRLPSISSSIRLPSAPSASDESARVPLSLNELANVDTRKRKASRNVKDEGKDEAPVAKQRKVSRA